ncbi:MAG: matrixin family metalloprotease [Actinomycetota bacterium]
MTRRRSLKMLMVACLSSTAIIPLWAGGASSQIDAMPSIPAVDLLRMANVAAPPDGVSLRLHMDFPEDAPLVAGGLTIYSLTATVSPEGVSQVEHAATAQETSAAAGGVDECSDPAFTPSSSLWGAEDMPIKWRMHRRSFPRELDNYRTKRVIRKAHRVWPRAQTDCSTSDKVGFSFNYLGPSNRSVKYDGTNLVEFGELDGPLATNYTWYQGSEMLEVDLRLNKAYSWTPRYGGNRYNIQNVVAHEIGHQIGLEDLGDPHGALTMFARIFKGETSKLTLGRGDLKGAGFVSP